MCVCVCLCVNFKYDLTDMSKGQFIGHRDDFSVVK